MHDCNDIAYGGPQACNTTDVAGNAVIHPNATNIKHTIATEGTGTYNDPITAAASADTDPASPTAANPVHKFESYGGVTLTPGTIIYNPMVQKYYIMEDSCIECGDEFACYISPEDTDDYDGSGVKKSGPVPNCTPGANLHIDFWMGPNTTVTDTNQEQTCEDNSTAGADWTGGGGQIIVNPPDNLPVSTTTLCTAAGSLLDVEPGSPPRLATGALRARRSAEYVRYFGSGGTVGAQVETPAPTIVNPSSGETVVAPVDV